MAVSGVHQHISEWPHIGCVDGFMNIVISIARIGVTGVTWGNASVIRAWNGFTGLRYFAISIGVVGECATTLGAV